jgi:hypothetical protein
MASLEAKFHEIHDLVVAKNGDIYLADSFNYRIRKVDGKTGRITLIASTGKQVQQWKVGGALRLVYAPDGRHLVGATEEGNVYVLRLAEAAAGTK